MREREKRDTNSERVREKYVLSQLEKFAMKFAPRTYTIEYLSAVTGIIHNSQEEIAIAITLNLEPNRPNLNSRSVT